MIKYIVIAIYDSGYGFQVNENGKNLTYDEMKKYEDIFNKYDYDFYHGGKYEELIERYKELDFDLIIVVDNSEISIIDRRIKK